MFSGLTTKASEAVVASTTTITQLADVLLVSGNTSIATINPNFGGGFGGICIIVPTASNVATLTTGNIAVAVTMPVGRATVLAYSSLNSKWYPGAIS